MRRRTVLVTAGAATLLGGLGIWRWRRAVPRASEFAGLRPGRRIDRWTVVAVHDVHLGAVPIVMATAEGERFQVDVLARDPGGPHGVAETDRFALFIANRGDGHTATAEEHGLGAMAIAVVMRDAESQPGASFPDLLTLSQRAASHPQGAYGVPLG
jgi:hypothetical protein